MNRAGRGRPLRFVGAVLLGWIGLRLALLGGESPMISPGASAPRPPSPGRGPPIVPERRALPQALAAALPVLPRRSRADRSPVPSPPRTVPPAEPSRAEVPRAAAPAPAPLHSIQAVPLVFEGASAGPAAARWQASAWLVARPGRGIGAAPGTGQIGGSQYGLRLRHPIAALGRIAAYGRIAGPLRGRGAEAALGIEWQPAGPRLRLAAEQRIGLDGTRGGPGIGLVAGEDRRILTRFRLEAYGQAGVIARARMEPYADGALRLSSPAAIGGAAGLALGMGAWGAVQRDTGRLDIGPGLVTQLPIGATRARIALDWRQRVAGRARPGSGVALTLAGDF